MALTLDLRLEHTVDAVYLVDHTGDYHAVNNPGGWGAPNKARGDVASFMVNVLYPHDTSIVTALNVYPSFPDVGADAYDLTGAIEAVMTLADGIYALQVTVTFGDATTATFENYFSLRTVDLVKRLVGLSQTNLDIVDFQTVKTQYDKMLYAFEGSQHELVEEMLSDINDTLDGCGVDLSGC